MGKRSEKEKANKPSTWGAETETEFTLNAWEGHRKERALRRDMFCFTRSAQAQQSPTQSHTPIGWDLEEMQRLLRAVLATVPVTDPKMPHELPYAGFDINDPFDHEPPRKLEDEPLFPLEEVPLVKNRYQVVYGYVRHTDKNQVRTWYKDEDNTLEKFLCYLAEMYLPDDMMVRRWAIDFTYDWKTPDPDDTFWNLIKSIFSPKRKRREETDYYELK